MSANLFIPPFSQLEHIQYSILSSSDVKQNSFVEIKNQSQFVGGQPVPFGIYDSKQGTFSYEFPCSTCGEDKNTCLAHFASIDLAGNYVLQPMFLKVLTKWLKIVCFNCSKPTFNIEEIKLEPLPKRLDKFSKIVSTTSDDESGKKLKPCPHCGAEKFFIRRVRDDKSAFEMVIKNVKINPITRRISTKEINDVINRISDDDVLLMVGKLSKHPRKMILDRILILGAPNRPESRAASNNRVRIEDQSYWAKALITDVQQQNTDGIRLNSHYYESVYGPVSSKTTRYQGGGSQQQITSIKQRIPGKQYGRIRANLLGKRIRNVQRAVIVGNSSLQLTQIGIPISEAKKQSIPVRVDVSNRDQLMVYFLNGKSKYPGCSKIVKQDGSEYQPDANITLDFGDIIYHDLINGTPLAVNRAPSLLPSSIIVMDAVVHNHDVLEFNPNVCPEFNADFDGDAMNAITIQNQGNCIEGKVVSGMSQFVMSHKDSTPILGQIQDGIMGLSFLTRTNVQYSKLHAMRSFGRTLLAPKFNADTYSGRDLITMTLAGDGININFATKPTTFKEDSHLPYILPGVPASDLKVIIENGVHKSGILDQASIGGGIPAGLYHVIYSQYGAAKCLRVIFNMQQLAISHLHHDELTISYGDLLPDGGASSAAKIGEVPAGIGKKSPMDIAIDNVVAALNVENEKQIENLDNGNILAPIGKTIEEHFEEIQINMLRMMELTDIIMKAIDPKTNNFYKMISAGAKGKLSNLQAMMAIAGLIAVNEKLPPNKFGYKRTLPYFQRCDMSMESRGFVRQSLLVGNKLPGMYFQSMAERHSLILKALFTAVIGAENRTANKNLEGVIINNLLHAINGPIILHNIYGEDGIDTRRVIQVEMPTLLISDADLEKWKVDTKVGELYFNMIKEDRAFMRKYYMKLHEIGNTSVLSGRVMVPVDIKRVLNDVIFGFEGDVKEPSADEMDALLERVIEFSTGELKYVMLNDAAFRLNIPIPEYRECATKCMAILTRAVLSPAALAKCNMEMLEQILYRIIDQYSRALVDYGTCVGIIAAQSTSEPLTQYVLHSTHHAASGGTKKGGVRKLKEIISPKESNMTDAIMTIFLGEDKSPATAKWVADNIQNLVFGEFVMVSQIIEEYSYGNVQHPDLQGDKKIFDEFTKYYPLLVPPGNLTKWITRFEISREKLLIKNISLVTIVDALRKTYPLSFIMHNNENSANIIIRIYWQPFGKLREYPSLEDMKDLVGELLSAKVRGIDMISNTSFKKEMPMVSIGENGAIVRDKKEPLINTEGSNIYEVLLSPMRRYIDPLRIRSDSVMETYNMFGIEAARLLIIEELHKIAPKTNPRHLMIYADEMCSSGVPTSIERAGLRTRQYNNILLRISHQVPIEALQYAAANEIKSPIDGISPSLIMGTTPSIGTFYNKLVVNEDFVRRYAVSAEQQIEKMAEL